MMNSSHQCCCHLNAKENDWIANECAWSINYMAVNSFCLVWWQCRIGFKNFAVPPSHFTTTYLSLGSYCTKKIITPWPLRVTLCLQQVLNITSSLSHPYPCTWISCCLLFIQFQIMSPSQFPLINSYLLTFERERGWWPSLVQHGIEKCELISSNLRLINSLCITFLQTKSWGVHGHVILKSPDFFYFNHLVFEQQLHNSL